MTLRSSPSLETWAGGTSCVTLRQPAARARSAPSSEHVLTMTGVVLMGKKACGGGLGRTFIREKRLGENHSPLPLLSVQACDGIDFIMNLPRWNALTPTRCLAPFMGAATSLRCPNATGRSPLHSEKSVLGTVWTGDKGNTCTET